MSLLEENDEDEDFIQRNIWNKKQKSFKRKY